MSLIPDAGQISQVMSPRGQSEHSHGGRRCIGARLLFFTFHCED